MRDIGVLKERIEYAERHLQAAHSARERESEALMAMWAQIRDRFEAQEKEIGRFREEVETLTRVNDELSTLVDQLIATVEGTVEMGKNETVPEVARLADDLLRSEPEKATPMASAPAPAAEDDPLSLDGMETDDPLDLGTPLDEPAEDGGASFGDMLNKAMEDDDIAMPEPVMDESASVGIRDLIARIEGSVGSDADDADQDPDDDLSRELREIEKLRNQLSGLHNKISKTG